MNILQAFGSPTIIAHVNNKPVMLFGSDRFPILAQVLGKLPVTGKSMCTGNARHYENTPIQIY